MSEDSTKSTVLIKELLGMIDEFLQHMSALEAENQDLRERLSSTTSQEVAPVADPTQALVIDPDDAQAGVLLKTLGERHCDAERATNSAEALKLVAAKEYGLVIVESKLGTESGLELLKKLREKLPDSELLIIVGFTSADIAVQALRVGASDFMLRPLTAEDVADKLSTVFKERQLKKASRKYLNNLRDRYQKLLKTYYEEK